MAPRTVRNQHGQKLIALPNSAADRTHRIKTAPASSLLRRRQLTVGGDGDGPARDPRLDAGAIQTGPGQGYALDQERRFEDYTKVPAIYILRVELGPNAGNNAADSVTLRPEQFLLRRITWRVTQPMFAFFDGAVTHRLPIAPPLTPAYDSASGIALRWGDEFTKFLGGTGPEPSGLLGALCGEVNGFLDMTREVLMAGKQTISAFLERGQDLQPFAAAMPFVAMVNAGGAATAADYVDTSIEAEAQIVEIQFHGIGLLPPGTNYSGGA